MRFVYGLILTLILSSCSTTTVYIVRHAEKVNESDTTNLSPAGYIRAADLAKTLANRHIDSIFTTPYQRTRQTAQPLANQLNLPLIEYPARPTQAIINRITPMRNKTVLVVGHSNTILNIAKGLGAQPTLTQIESEDFDNLLQVKIYRGLFRRSVTTSLATYGQVTPP